jgi:hypothetical protein
MTTEGDDEPPVGDSAAFIAWLETVPDAERRYALATSALEHHQDLIRQFSAMRADAVADAAEEDSISGVARRLGVSRQRAHQLVQEARARSQKPRTEEGGKGRRRGKQP